MQTGFHLAFGRSKDGCDLGQGIAFQVIEIQNYMRVGGQAAQDILDIPSRFVLFLCCDLDRRVFILDLRQDFTLFPATPAIRLVADYPISS